MTGTDVATYTRQRPGVSAFVLKDGVRLPRLLHLLRAGLDGLWGMYQWLDRATQGAQRDGRLVAPPR